MKHFSETTKTESYSGWSKRLFAWMMSKVGNIDDDAISLKNCSCAETAVELKQALFADLHGNILEIGPGTGANFPYYPAGIYWIGVEPNPFMHPYLRKEAEKFGLDIELRNGTAEHLELEDNSMDTVVSTLVLCSVEDLTRTLQEVLRVLKPGGRFIFFEHVAAPEKTWLRQVQSWVQPVWKVAFDGCHPDRETWVAIENAGFERVDYQHFQNPVPIVSPGIAGVATKKATSMAASS